MFPPQCRRPGRLWYVSDGFIWDDQPPRYRREGGRPLECSSKLFLFNPQRKAARVQIRFFHTDRPPTGLRRTVSAGRVESLELATLPEVPHRQSFWIVVEADAPILPQACHEDYTFWDPVPDALVSVAPYPGPLKDETSWFFPDCFQGGWQPFWHELETISILNPSRKPARVTLRYCLRVRDQWAKEQIEIPAQRVAQLDMWERNPRLFGEERGVYVKLQNEYTVKVDSTVPVVAQVTRRARWGGRPSVIGTKSSMPFPLRGPGHRTWYYPGGAVMDRGVLPRGKNFDVSWNLLFTANMSERRSAAARVTFHRADGSSTRSEAIRIPPLKADLQWLHLPPWLGKHVPLNEPWGMTIRADRPVVTEVCGAEYEMWSTMCPGAMIGVNLHPGPLDEERLWWLGIGRSGGTDELPTQWEQTYQFLNPGRRAANVTLRFLGLKGKPFERRLTVGPGAAARVVSTEIAGLPVHAPFAAVAEGDRPFCAQVFGRTFTRGLAFTRAMYSFIGLPMKPGAAR